MVSPNASSKGRASSASHVSRSPLGRTLDSLQASLVRFQAAFDAARGRCPELAPFATPGAIVVALDAATGRPLEERYALVATLVREHAANSRGPALWSTLLLVAFRPLLLRLRSQVGRPEDEEHDARVLAAFLDALARIKAAGSFDYAAVALQRGTLKALRRDRDADRRNTADAVFDEDDHTRCEPHALTLGDARADIAWADAREQKLASLVRPKARRARAAPEVFPASLPLPRPVHDQATFTGAST